LPHKNLLRAKQVADFSCMVREMLADMGTPDPCLDAHGKQIKILSNLFRVHAKEDPPRDWVKPILIQLVKQAVNALHTDATMPVQLQCAIADCIVIVCFFL